MSVGALYLILKVIATLGSAIFTWMKLYRWFSRRARRNRRKV